MLQHCFLTGTDTDIGKTFSACALLHAWRRAGFSAVGYKPVAAGVEADGRNADADALLAASSPGFQLADINPLCLPDACSPHIAAARAGAAIDLAPLLAGFAALRARAERIVVEGAGGFIVPLGAGLDTAILARALDLPVVLVVGLRLGCLNHALLTQEAILSRGLRFAGWIGNVLHPDMPFLEENISSLRERLVAPCLAVLPRSASPAEAAQGFAAAAGVQSAST